jgi:hypothetical protein
MGPWLWKPVTKFIVDLIMLHDNEASNLALKGMVDADFASQPLQ